MSDKNKVNYLVHLNAESDWCIWDEDKNLVAVFHGEKSKENAKSIASKLNLREAYEELEACSLSLEKSMRLHNSTAGAGPMAKFLSALESIKITKSKLGYL